MWSVILFVLGVLLLVVLAIGITFMLGMRAKTPWVLDRIRHVARTVTNPYQMRSAGTPGAMASVIEHRGRVSGRAYRTPVEAVATEDGFVIATVYGPRTDWLKNVLASGSATIVDEGQAYEVDRPVIVPIEAAETYFPAKSRRAHQRFRVGECLRVRTISHSTEEVGARP
jgi:deazaflavin-dependent oxidoreductase (nitroreductase family)